MRYFLCLSLAVIILLKFSYLHAQTELNGEYVANIGARYIDGTNIELIESVEIATTFKDRFHSIEQQDSFMISFSPLSAPNRLLLKDDIVENLEKDFRIKFIIYFYDEKHNLMNREDSLFSKFLLEKTSFANLYVIETIKTEQIKIINSSTNIRYIKFVQVKIIKSSSSKVELFIEDSDNKHFPTGEYIANIGAKYIDRSNIDLIERVEIATTFKDRFYSIEQQDNIMISFSPRSTSNPLLLKGKIKDELIENLEKDFRIKFTIYIYDEKHTLMSIDSLFSKFQLEGPLIKNRAVIHTIKLEQIEIINNSAHIKYVQFGQIKIIKSSSSKIELIIDDSDNKLFPTQAKTIIFKIPSTQHISSIDSFSIDGRPVKDLEHEYADGEIHFRGEPSFIDKLRDGYHQFSAWVDGLREDVNLWKEQMELKPFQIEKFGKSYALIIGISKYRKPFHNLPMVESQAKELGKILERNNFQVVYLLDTKEKVTRARVDSTIRALNKQMDVHKDRFLFYYGGHGKIIKPPYAFADSVAYLILSDYDLNDLDNTCIPMKEIRDGWYLKSVSAKHALYAIDACGAGIKTRSSNLDSIEIQKFKDLNYIYALTKDAGRTVVTAGSDAQEVLAKGIFTDALIRAVHGEADSLCGDRNGVTTMDELSIYLTKEVTYRALSNNLSQKPDRNDYPPGRGQFIFIHYPTFEEIIQPTKK